MTADFQSHILVSVPNVTLLTVATVENGDLSLECITFENNHTPQPNSKSKEVSGNTNNTVYLILHLNNHVYPIDPAIPLHLKHLPSGERTYSFRPTEGTGIPEVHLTIPSPPSDTHLKDAHEILDHVLSQYASLHHDSSGLPPIPTYDQAISTNFAGMHLDNPGLKGHLVLLDEASGEVVGELPRTLNIKEDETVRAGEKAAKAHDGVAAPVVLELPPNVYDEYMSGKSISSGEGEELAEVREVFVTVIPPEERDWMTRGAGLFSTAISASTTLVISGISAASDYYIAHSNAYTPPEPSNSKGSSPSSSRPILTPSTSSGSGSQSQASSSLPTDHSPSPHPAFTTVHALSEKAAWASSKTADLVGGLIRRAVGSTESIASGAAETPPGKKKPLKISDKLMLSAGLVLATVDDSAKRLMDAGSEKLGAIVGHKYGPQAGQSTLLAAHTTRNVVLVYVDMQGFARRALIKKAGKEWVKSKFKGKEKK